LSIVPQAVASAVELESAIAGILSRIDFLWIPPDPSLNSDETVEVIGKLAAKYRVPFMGPHDRYVAAGALFSIALDPVAAGRQAGDLANRILQGVSPSNIPIQELDRPRVILNLKAAKLLGLEVPDDIRNIAAKIYQ
jgi:putative ABC transport system substrate-binding protein